MMKEYISNFKMINRLPGAIILFISACLVQFSCGDKPLSSLEATDEEAIYNVLFVDYARLTKLEIFPDELPDTAAFVQNPDTTNPLCWHVVDSTSEDLNIIIADEPVKIDIGLVYEANITYSKTWTGVFRTMRYNQQADSLERYAKEFTLRGTRDAVSQQWGTPGARHRGWILTTIDDARFISPGTSYHFLEYLFYDSPSNPDSIFYSGSYDPRGILKFDPAEEIAVRYGFLDETDFLLFMIPRANTGYQPATAQPISEHEYEVVFNLPETGKLYGQLRFLVINAGDFATAYRASGFSYGYQVR